jgi:hypothetical protein
LPGFSQWNAQLVPIEHCAPLQAEALQSVPSRHVVALSEQPVQLEVSNVQAPVHGKLPAPPMPRSPHDVAGTSLPSQSSPGSVESLPQTEQLPVS